MIGIHFPDYGLGHIFLSVAGCRTGSLAPSPPNEANATRAQKMGDVLPGDGEGQAGALRQQQQRRRRVRRGQRKRGPARPPPGSQGRNRLYYPLIYFDSIQFIFEHFLNETKKLSLPLYSITFQNRITDHSRGEGQDYYKWLGQQVG